MLSQFSHSQKILDIGVFKSEDYDSKKDRPLENIPFFPETLLINCSSDLSTRSMSLNPEIICKYTRKATSAFVPGPLKLFKESATVLSEPLCNQIDILTPSDPLLQIKDLQSKSNRDDIEIRRLNEKVDKLLEVIKTQRSNYEKELAVQKLPQNLSKLLDDQNKLLNDALDLPENIFDDIMSEVMEESKEEAEKTSPCHTTDYSKIPRVPSKTIKKSISLSEYKARKASEVRKICHGITRQ